MDPLVGLEFSGATLTPFDEFAPGQGALGRPVWGPQELLRDLELRLGLAGGVEGLSAVRTAQWAARIDRIAAVDRFYSASFAVDRLGTAAAVLELRDTLVNAGWDGGAIAGGGARLDAIVELESLADVALTRGFGDRVARVAGALEERGRSGNARLYDGLTLAESAACWSSVWNRVFRGLARAGTELSQLAVSLPGAPAETDLGKVQAALRSPAVSRGDQPARLRGDGSFVLVTAETAFEAAEGAAALLRGAITETGIEECVVIREGEASALDHAFCLQQLPALGLSATNRWRPALQLLPLALELAFEPKDPFRVLELLRLPRGPFAGRVGRRLARALARSPGIGGRAWEEAKARLTEPRDEALALIAAWLERPGADPVLGAPKEDLLELIERVRGFIVQRIAKSPNDATLFAAVDHADAVAAALEADVRERFDLVNVRRLSEFALKGGVPLDLLQEAAGRVSHVSSALALWVARRTVLWWPFGGETARGVTRGWRRQELAALQRAGLCISPVGLLERQRWSGWRRAVGAATERLILVAPRTVAGQPQRTHPLWDEIVARLRLDEASQARVTYKVDEVVRPDAPDKVVGAGGVDGFADLEAFENAQWTPSLATEQLEPLTLPAAPPTWHVALSEAPCFSPYSAASLGALLACPLRWCLEALAGLEAEEPGLPAPYLLAGTLGHRLLEELVLEGALTATQDDFTNRAERTVDLLIEREGALLLRAGKAHERAQRRRQLVAAVCALRELLDANRLTVVAIERPFQVPWRNGSLTGRWDLLVSAGSGASGVIDVKLGQTRYVSLLESGTALQLAVYVKALELLEGTAAFATYFSLRTRRLLGLSHSNLEGMRAVRGPRLLETWQRVERTLPLVEARVAGGQLDATGVRNAPPLLDSLGVPKEQQAEHFDTIPSQICEHCRFDGVCGKRWEQWQ